jgi:hypothetical protein
MLAQAECIIFHLAALACDLVAVSRAASRTLPRKRLRHGFRGTHAGHASEQVAISGKFDASGAAENASLWKRQGNESGGCLPELQRLHPKAAFWSHS